MLAVQAPFRHDASALRASFSYLFLEFSKYVSPCKRRFYAVPAPRVHALFVIFYRSASIIPAWNPAPKHFFLQQSRESALFLQKDYLAYIQYYLYLLLLYLT